MAFSFAYNNILLLLFFQYDLLLQGKKKHSYWIAFIYVCRSLKKKEYIYATTDRLNKHVLLMKIFQ